MERPAPGLRLEAITPLRQEIMRIWRTFRPVDRAFIQGIIGDVVMLIETPVDWIFLRTAAEFWDPRHAVFNFQGTELAPTIEDYTTLIQKPTPTTQGIFVPNPFAVIQSQLSTLSAPHFGSSASYTRIPDQSSGCYSSPGNQRQIGEHGVMNNERRAWSLRKAKESHRKNLQAKDPENSGAGTAALFITESLKHRKVPNMGL
ncbi:hypothetical protein CDL15_Pgr016400 [Punica granatum]|uniref:DUF7745 domain-containing protein n=1 Tax=Punica granatum TaxID=22663 RepID=A0A218XWJ1_PUNGR|nr:hypothetical protein CDL15_Pgr016400 [Punica granatum]